MLIVRCVSRSCLAPVVVSGTLQCNMQKPWYDFPFFWLRFDFVEAMERKWN